MTNKNANTHVTLARLSRCLGLQYYQVQYLVQTGRIPEGEVRTASNHRAWTAEQAETIEKWYRDYRRIGQGCCRKTGRERMGMGSPRQADPGKPASQSGRSPAGSWLQHERLFQC